MLQELRFQLSTAILTVLTIAAAVAAALNYQQIHRFRLPDDGVTWGDRIQPGGHGEVVALRVAPNGPADRAGIRVNDVLKSIQSAPVADTSDVPRRLAYVGAWAKAAYVVSRPSATKGTGEMTQVDVPASVIVGEAARGIAITWQYVVGVAYLAIGLFVYFRRGSAYKARHFYIFCLASFIFSCFHRTGKLNGFDQVIDWGNLIAGWLAPALFLHFCLTFPEPRSWFKRYWAVAIYLPGAILTLVTAGFASSLFFSPGNSVLDVREALDRSWMGLLTATYLLSGLVLQQGYRKAEDPVIRQQLKWLRNGMLFGFAPFAVLNAIPFVLNLPFHSWMNYAVVTLPLIPLTIAIAIVRYRLMDVDVIFRRGYAYTLATLLVLASFYGLVISLGTLVKKNFEHLDNTWVIAVMLIATFLFQPLRNWIQERLDRYFYRDRYDYRRTLIGFARELNSETDLDHMLGSVADRLMQTLSIRHVAFFLAEPVESTPQPPADTTPVAHPVSPWRLRMSRDSSALPLHSPGSLDLSFLDWPRSGMQDAPYIFFERTRYHLDAIAGSWPATVRQTIADLDLNYYVPCTVRGRTIAFLGVSRTEKGEFLSSDDVELLQTLSNYVGIAAENANLYR